MLIQTLKNRLVMHLNHQTVNIVTAGFLRSPDSELIRLGTEYGGWWVLENRLLSSNQKRVLISAGLGQDVSFDKAMLEHGFDLFGLDPLTPSISFAINELSDYSNKHILQFGLWVKSGEVQFFFPKDASHDSWSITNSQSAPDTHSEALPVVSIPHLYESFPELRQYDYVVLKMDIEGAEVPVLLDLDFSNYHFDFLAVEMDYISMIPFLNFLERIRKIIYVRRVMQKIRNSGFELIFTENFNFFWNLKTDRL